MKIKKRKKKKKKIKIFQKNSKINLKEKKKIYLIDILNIIKVGIAIDKVWNLRIN